MVSLVRAVALKYFAVQVLTLFLLQFPQLPNLAHATIKQSHHVPVPGR
jgi:hypothetical protein